MQYKNFDQIIAYKCKKCGMIVEIPSAHLCVISDVTAANPSLIYKYNLGD